MVIVRDDIKKYETLGKCLYLLMITAAIITMTLIVESLFGSSSSLKIYSAIPLLVIGAACAFISVIKKMKTGK